MDNNSFTKRGVKRHKKSISIQSVFLLLVLHYYSKIN